VRSPLVAATLVAVLAACSSSASGPKQPTPPAGDGAGDETPVRPPAPVEGIACEEGPCMLHPGTGNHHECLNPSAGGCFQFGRRCLPASLCLPDGAGVYRQCAEPDEGRCLRFGDPCEPAGRCVFDAATRKYRTCEELDAGRCQRFGAPCKPGPPAAARSG
jgi:hypothetical protein